MTEPEIPDSLGFLFGDLTESGADREKNQTTPKTLENSSASAPAERPFPSRRELRAQREAAERALARGLEVPAVEAPAASVAPSAATTPAESADAVLASILGAAPAAAAPAVAAPASPAPVESASAAPAEPARVVPAATVEPVVAPAAALVVSSTAIERIAPAAESVTAEVAPAPQAELPGIPAPASVAHPELVPAASAVPAAARVRRPARAARPAAGAAFSKPAAASAKPASASKRSIRQRITATGTMVLVGGLFASLALPAYAFDDSGAPTAATQRALEGSTQKLDVADDVAVGTTARDAYGVTSAADLRGLYANALRQKNLQAYLNSGAKALGDDYPWATDLTRSEGGGLSPLRYYYRECVDFVAWRLNRDAGTTSAPYKWDWSTLTPNGGNASNWKAAWINHGWATGNTPEVGAVAWFNYNHVAYVSGILGDGSVLLEEYNMGGKHVYGQRVVQPSEVPLFLYAPPA
ncbi:CHAP domain-containing protein [Schumannella sp. 10F1B-5-1]|uniref:CHAP domain-containing protein n=1 Tax=Schumannella sp. 10F1B-5-1 TaxID=2590780 RepID=UPI001130C759|nr:CHAP domain-containing protein [Schumannella sp. 10F1B-5-1]TPW72882.1 CHAP domain-containing protein [Schumannella sp. 10F1B-5-1]